MDISQVISKYHAFFPNKSETLIKDAFAVAEEKHRTQKRETGEPYIQHPLNVAFLVAKIGMGEETIAAALLHDVAEDTSFGIEQISERFGKTVASLVNGVTKTKSLPHYQKNLQEYEIENLRRLFLFTAEDLRVVVIRLADRLHNMRTLSGKSEKRRREIALETLKVYTPLANRLCIGEFKGELEDLAFPYVYPEAYKWIKSHLLATYRARKQYTEKKIKELKSVLSGAKVPYLDIHGRAKHLYSLYRKLLLHELDIDSIYDLVAIRVIVPARQDCYRALGVIHEHWPPLPGRLKDYIAAPKLNGYQSLHTTVAFSEKNSGEIQIRTPEMHADAEFGIAAHWAYDTSGKGDLSAKATNPSKNILNWLRSPRRTKEHWLEKIGALSKNASKDFLSTLTSDYLKDRILVSSNDGKTHDLPEEATVLDLAYDIGPSFGNHCVGAKINSKFASPETILHNTDRAFILTDAQAKPSERWLTIVKTDKARRSIMEWLKAHETTPIATKGEEILRKELITHKHLTLKSLPKHLFSKAVHELNFESLTELYAALGRGDITVHQVLRLIEVDPIYSESLTQAKAPDVIVHNKMPVPYTTTLAECCSPAPGDMIVGLLNSQNQIVIHHEHCSQVSKTPASMHIALSWRELHRQVHHFRIEVKASGRPGLLADIAKIFAQYDVGILELHTFHIELELLRGVFGVESDTKEGIEMALRDIRKLKEVLEAKLVQRGIS